MAKKSPSARAHRSKSSGFAPLLGTWLNPLLVPLLVGYLIWYFLQPGFFGSYRIADMLGLLLPDELLRATWEGPEDYSGFGGADRMGPLLLALIWTGLGYLIGRPLTEPLLSLLTRVELAALSILVGLGLLSTTVLLLGLSGLLNRLGLMASVISLLLLGFVLRKRMPAMVTDQVSANCSKPKTPDVESRALFRRKET